jgi:L-lactate dehydrogenase complex protein LldE
VKVLRRAGVDVTFPADQTCCGQVGYNGGFEQEAREVALHFMDVFDGDEPVVVPSGSCASMIKIFYLDLFADDPVLLERAQRLSERTHEFSDFLVNVLEVENVGAAFSGTVTYHDACHLLRELHISAEPRALIEGVSGAELAEMTDSDRCCGFGGLFSVKFPEVSAAILGEKLENIEASGAEVVVANDCGCLMHMRGALSRKGMRQRAMHIAELLASQSGLAVGQPERPEA